MINTFADLAMMWLFVSSTRPDDRLHPLAAVVACSTGPYFFNMYPTIMNTALFGLDVSDLKDVKQALRTFEEIYTRDSTFKSIMLGAYTFFIVFAGLLIASGLLRCVRQDRRMTKCEISVRTGVPCAAGFILCMAFYNKYFDVFHSQLFPNGPMSILIIGHIMLIVCLIYGVFATRKIKDPSIHIIALHRHRFMFSEFESLVRLIFFASIILLEPYRSRFRFRERFYRTTTRECSIVPDSAPVQVVAQPEPKKINLDDMPPNYENMYPPTYDAAQTLPTTWTITPPSRQYYGVPVEMTPVETK
uniref:Uncharacterized protein n=2 Tax=Caenorhabditis japonica TaxID=281687 RepID=A0A8R1DFY5_CAEJA